MSSNKVFSDYFYERRERLICERIDADLERLRTEVAHLYSPCTIRIMNIRAQGMLSIQEMLSFEPARRQAILSALLYHDALWRLEAAHLMLRIAVLNVAFSDLRACLENIVVAHMIEHLDSEAVKFLKGEKINPNKIS